MDRERKPYRHSTTFYRKCKYKINTNHTLLSEEITQNKPCPALQQDLHKPSTLNLPNTSSLRNDLFLKESLAKSQIELIRENEEFNNTDNEEENDGTHTYNLQENLRTWSVTHKPSISALNDLLKILNENGLKLPKDGRTLLRTYDIQIKPMGHGHFWYNGIKQSLENVVDFINIDKVPYIELIFNVDGMSLFNSTASEIWPIAFAIHGMPQIKPMFAAIFYGTGKPPLELFLEDFIAELREVLKNGLFFNGKKLHVKFKCFVCDTPARAFLKGTPYFNAGKSSCIKCTVEGKWDKKGRHMSYPKFDCPLRTDCSFRNKLDEDHHIHNTPLVDLPIDMVEDFIIADSLHLFDLGIMRKCLMSWCTGSYNFQTKLRGSEIDLLNQLLESCEKIRPKEIQRTIRSVKFLKYWKGTEYRVMLLYLGFVVLKDVLTKEVYEHYVLLACAATILSCKTYLKYIEIAKILLDDYLEGCINIYGSDSISSNFHNLCHVIDDVKKFGCLSDISSYQFENSLGHLKSLVRSGKQPLTQIANWVKRMSITNTNKICSDSVQNRDICVKGKISDGVYTKIYIQDIMFSDDGKNSWFLSKTNDIVKIENVQQHSTHYSITGSALDSREDFFLAPFKSSKLNIYSSNGVRCSQSEELQPKMLPSRSYTTADIRCKLFQLRYKNKFVFFPLLHSLDVFI